MKRQRKDALIFITSIAINVVILFLIPGINEKDTKEQRLKVGLISTRSTGKKTTSSTGGQNKSQPAIPKGAVEVKAEPKQKNEAITTEIKRLSLDDLAKTISKRETELLTTTKSTNRSVNSEVKGVLDKKDLNEVKSTSSTRTSTDSLAISKENSVVDRGIPTDMTSDVNLNFQDNAGTDLGLRTMVDKNSDDTYLPVGYSLGVDDGDIIAKWDPNNREPSYPESAQLKGLQGKVLLKMHIDKSGKVTSAFIEKGSGVPEINMAIEEIARTWKIYLTKNGLNIQGNVTLEYSFKLVGNS